MKIKLNMKYPHVDLKNESQVMERVEIIFLLSIYMWFGSYTYVIMHATRRNLNKKIIKMEL